ncbi:hypothetical protein [Paenibacillus sp. J2TS4]|uniref:hypothetical protein n=1 Tax=Paenibacillus sp. J2TS4 TaxID=2807194 RepID=UPI001B0B7924|nr:hypothetical protein [Paenibacillus sp. J2TS4]GIP32224.1 hypothetical protein J2TS4_14340 [Paenibacillus sp. J2TS4]
MSLLLPIVTIGLVLLGSVCLFIAMENDRRVNEQLRKEVPGKAQTELGMRPVDVFRKLFIKVRNAE